MNDSILFFQLESGAAGDMLAAALLGLVDDPEASISRLRALKLPGIDFTLSRISRSGICGNLFDVSVNGEIEAPLPCPVPHHNHDHPDHSSHHEHLDHHDHPGHHHHHHVSLAEIRGRIEALALPPETRADALAVYDLLAEAESKAHGAPVPQIHFHEVGSLDALADVVSVCSLVSEIAPKRIVAAPPLVGGGTVRCAHGVLPVPAPATANLLEGLPWRGGAAEDGELLTPTGAALLRRFVSEWGSAPEARWLRTGIGFGHRETPTRVNAVRAFLGRPSARCAPAAAGAESPSSGPNGSISELLCNIDDMTGEALGRSCERLRALPGVVDVALSPLQMKKNRPGQLLRLLCSTASADSAAAAILRETTTFGVRRADMARYELSRSFEKRPAPGGGPDIPWKTGTGYGTEKAKPEFDAIP